MENKVEVNAHENLQIIYKNHIPYGIRDKSGYLFFFSKIDKYTNQELRYRKETEERFALADYLLEALKKRKPVEKSIDAQLVKTAKEKYWQGYVISGGTFHYTQKHRDTYEEALADAGRMLDELKGRI